MKHPSHNQIVCILINLRGYTRGGMVVWSMALHYPQRVRAVASLNTPFYPPNPHKNPLEGLGTNPPLPILPSQKDDEVAMDRCAQTECFDKQTNKQTIFLSFFLLLTGMRQQPGVYDYQLYFQDEVSVKSSIVYCCQVVCSTLNWTVCVCTRERERERESPNSYVEEMKTCFHKSKT